MALPESVCHGRRIDCQSTRRHARCGDTVTMPGEGVHGGPATTATRAGCNAQRIRVDSTGVATVLVAAKDAVAVTRSDRL